MSEINKGYYAIIPASIRYDNDIPANAKLFYAEITALCNEKGYCWAGNDYFIGLYETTDRTIRRWLSILSKKGYIKVEYQYKSGTKEILKRYIKLAGSSSSARDEKSLLGEDKNVRTYGQKCPIGEDKNVRDNNIINNNNIYKDIMSGKDKEPVDKSVDNSPKEDIKSLVISEIITYLNEKCSTNYKTSSEKTKKCINARLNEGYSLADFKKVIDTKATEWLNNPEMSKYLRPETLFGSKFEGYLNQKIVQTAKQNQAKKPANKFHNFDQHDDYVDLEEIARKRFEKKIKSLGLKTEKKCHQEGNKP